MKGAIELVLIILLGAVVGLADWYINENEKECHCPYHAQTVEQHNANVEALLND